MVRFYKRITSSIVALGLLMVACLLVYTAVIYREYVVNLDVSSHRFYEMTPFATEVYASGGEKIGEYFLERRYFIKFDDIPEHVVHAFIASEDKSFFSHIGISVHGIVRAVLGNVKAGKVSQGASTITQQVVREFFLTKKKRIDRKIREIVLSLIMEQKLSKQQIFELYVNKIYFGHRSYGLQAASRSFFRKEVKDLSVSEATLLSVLPRSPNKLDLRKNLRGAKVRQKFVLENLVRMGSLNKTEALEAYTQKNKIFDNNEEFSMAPYFVDYVKPQLERMFGKDFMIRGLRVYSTLDLNVQTALNKTINVALPKSLSDQVQASMYSIRPVDGAILGIVGGKNHDKTLYNRAVSSRREIGDMIIPVYLPLLITEGYSLISNVYGTGREKYRNNDRGGLSLYEFSQKPNVYLGMKMVSEVGLGNLLSFSKNLNLNIDNESLSFATGNTRQSLSSLVNVFSAIANEGMLTENHAISTVSDVKGNRLFQSKRNNKKVYSNLVSKKVSWVLRDAAKYGQASFITDHPDHGLLGYAGVSAGFHDAWYVGGNQSLLTGIWVGSEFGKARIFNNEESGRKAISAAFGKFYNHVPKQLWKVIHPTEEPEVLRFGRFDFKSLSPQRRSVPL